MLVLFWCWACLHSGGHLCDWVWCVKTQGCVLVQLVCWHHRHVHMITVRILLWGCELRGVSHWDTKCHLCWRLCCPRVFWRRARSSDSLFRYIRWVVTTHVLSFLSFDVVVRLRNVRPGVVRRKEVLYLKPEKCKFEKEETEFLGLIISKGKI